MTALLRGMFVGILSSLTTWILILAVYLWRSHASRLAHGASGLAADAGGWTYLLSRPLVIVLLTLAFGAGLWWGTRR
jgi:hypothetical protein